jgi:type I restriction enzyme R subunit
MTIRWRLLGRIMTAVLKDDTELFKQFIDNESFRPRYWRWSHDSSRIRLNT